MIYKSATLVFELSSFVGWYKYWYVIIFDSFDYLIKYLNDLHNALIN